MSDAKSYAHIQVAPPEVGVSKKKRSPFPFPDVRSKFDGLSFLSAFKIRFVVVPFVVAWPRNSFCCILVAIALVQLLVNSFLFHVLNQGLHCFCSRYGF